MKASELVEKLNTLISEHGDLDVQLRQTEFMWDTYDLGQVVIAPDWSDRSEGEFFLLGWKE